MTRETVSVPTLALDPPRSIAAAWHAGWAGAMILAVFALMIGIGRAPAEIWWAFLLILAPGLAGGLLTIHDSRRSRAVLLMLWAFASGAAAVLGGGVSGPFAVWCLAPVAAAAMLGGSNRMAQGAALSFLAAGVALVVRLAGYEPPPPSVRLDLWLSLISLVTMALALGAALLVARTRNRRHETRSADRLALIEEQPHLLLLLDASGLVVERFGVLPDAFAERSILGRSLLELPIESDRGAVQSAIRQALEDGVAAASFTPRRRPEQHLSLDLRALADGRMLAQISDRSAGQAREAALEAARADAESLAAGKSRFLANMSHELRTPLNAIMGFSDIMRAKMFGELPGKYVEYADLIHESGEHLLDLINDVLDMSKIEADRYELNREIMDAREPVAAALRILRVQADGQGIALRGILPPRPLEVDADRRALKQITINLVSNALKFTPSSGSVTVTAQDRGGAFELVVADTGVGIAKEDLERIGRPYAQVGDQDKKVMGTGLGLSLVRAFAELHGGTMTVESQLGEGTAVTVRLPVLTNAPAGPIDIAGENVVVFKPQR